MAVAGGSGGLGRALVDAFKNSPYKPMILARQVKIKHPLTVPTTDSKKANSELESETGVPVFQANYADQDLLVKLLEENKVDTVISTISDYDVPPLTNSDY